MLSRHCVAWRRRLQHDVLPQNSAAWFSMARHVVAWRDMAPDDVECRSIMWHGIGSAFDGLNRVWQFMTGVWQVSCRKPFLTVKNPTLVYWSWYLKNSCGEYTKLKKKTTKNYNGTDALSIRKNALIYFCVRTSVRQRSNLFFPDKKIQTSTKSPIIV